MGWPQQRLYKIPSSQTCGIGPLIFQNTLGQSTVGAYVLASGIQILCKMLAYVRISAMQGETIIVTPPKNANPIYLNYPA